MNKNIKPIIVSENNSIRDTMHAINGAFLQGAPTGIALIMDNAKKLLGIVTDGDIRRSLVNNVSIDEPVKSIMVRDPITVSEGLTESEMVELVVGKIKAGGRIRDVKVEHVIIVDKEGVVVDVVNFYELWESSNIKNKTICVVGLGFVGLTLAIILADSGFKVIGYDVMQDMVTDINNGNPPFYEEGLSSLLKFHINKGNFRAVSSLKKEIHDIYIVSVGTPVDRDHKPDIENIKKATIQIGKVLKKKDMVILRSTVPVGTTRDILLPILEKESNLKGGEAFYLAFAPERTVQGKALEELRSLPQIIGGLNKRSLDVASSFFSNLNTTIARMSSLEAAEMVKLVNNAYRDVTFAFANELAITCDHWGIDPVNVINAANQGYPRNNIPVPSPGVGGSCLKKDPYIYIESVSNMGFKGGLSLCSRKINDYMSLFVFNKIDLFIKQNKKDQDIKIFVIGFAFKGEPETSDIRDSTTVDLVAIMKNKTNWHIFGYDPVVDKDRIGRLDIAGCSIREGFKGADCVLIMNNHRSYFDVDILGLLELVNRPALFLDAWSLFPHKEIESVKGVFYGGLGGKD